MDQGTVVVVLGFFGTVITGAASVGVALIVNRKEREQSAETSLERTLRERLLLRDEQLTEMKEDNADLKMELTDALAEIERLKRGKRHEH